MLSNVFVEYNRRDVGATIYFFLTPTLTTIDFFLDRSTVTVYQSGLLMQLGADDPDQNCWLLLLSIST
jgi:hypothetical protein